MIILKNNIKVSSDLKEQQTNINTPSFGLNPINMSKSNNQNALSTVNLPSHLKNTKSVDQNQALIAATQNMQRLLTASPGEKNLSNQQRRQIMLNFLQQQPIQNNAYNQIASSMQSNQHSSIGKISDINKQQNQNFKKDRQTLNQTQNILYQQNNNQIFNNNISIQDNNMHSYLTSQRSKSNKKGTMVSSLLRTQNMNNNSRNVVQKQREYNSTFVATSALDISATQRSQLQNSTYDSIGKLPSLNRTQVKDSQQISNNKSYHLNEDKKNLKYHANQSDYENASTAIGGLNGTDIGSIMDSRSQMFSQQSRLKTRQTNERININNTVQIANQNNNNSFTQKHINKGEVCLDNERYTQANKIQETINSQNEFETDEDNLDFKSIQRRLFDKYAQNQFANEINLIQQKRKSDIIKKNKPEKVQTKDQEKVTEPHPQQNQQDQLLPQVNNQNGSQSSLTNNNESLIYAQQPNTTLKERMKMRREQIEKKEEEEKQQKIQEQQQILDLILDDEDLKIHQQMLAKQEAERLQKLEEENLRIKLMHQRMLGMKANSEVLKIKEEYENAHKCMMDYRMNLLSALIERKLGLKKKNTKTDSMINSMIYDIAKEQNQKVSEIGSYDQKNDSAEASILWPESNQYTHVQSKVHNSSLQSHYQSKQLDQIKNENVNQRLKSIYQDNNDDDFFDTNLIMKNAQQNKVHSKQKSQPPQQNDNIVNFLDLVFDSTKNQVVNDRQFMKIKKMVDEFYGYKPQTLKYETALKRILEKKKIRQSQDSSQRKKKQTAVTKLYIEGEEKTKMTQLDKFIKTYNYYIHKLLWSTADPFLQTKRKQYQIQCESHRLDKFANVFNRLKYDTNERKKTDEEIKKEHDLKYQDPFKSVGESYSPVRKIHNFFDMNSMMSTHRQNSRFSSTRGSHQHSINGRRKESTSINRQDSFNNLVEDIISPSKKQGGTTLNHFSSEQNQYQNTEFSKAITKLREQHSKHQSQKMNDMDIKILIAQKKLFANKQIHQNNSNNAVNRLASPMKDASFINLSPTKTMSNMDLL